MNFLAIDTSGTYLSLTAACGGVRRTRCLADCAMQHSVLLMDEADALLHEAGLTPAQCDFFAVCVGPGSFTGIRIGIATVKGLCFAADKPALALTSFDALAYAEEGGRLLALVDAGHGHFYACGYDEARNITLAPAFLTREEADAAIAEGYTPVASSALFAGCALRDPAEGLYRAAAAKYKNAAPAAALTALYLRKSSAEEKRG